MVPAVGAIPSLEMMLALGITLNVMYNIHLLRHLSVYSQIDIVFCLAVRAAL
jgi:hypothetical protein